MALFEYTAPVDPAGVVIALGSLIIISMIAYGLYLAIQWFRIILDAEMRRSVLESVIVNKIAEKRGIDLDKEIRKMQLIKTGKFKKQLEQEIYEEFLGKKGSKKE